MFKPCGDTVILEKFVEESPIALPDDIEQDNTDIYIVKDVGIGYVTEQGQIIPPEVRIGDKAVVMGKVLKIKVSKEIILIARAQDIVAYEREEK